MYGYDNSYSTTRHIISSMTPESGNIFHEKIGKVSSASSIDSIPADMQEPTVSSYNSDDLDKLSICLSEVSDAGDSKRSSLFNDIIQAQLAFWTLVISIFYTYAWQQHRKKFLFSLIMIVPPVIVICCTVSSMLTTIVILGRMFSSPLRFDDIFRFGSGIDEDDAQSFATNNLMGSRSSGLNCHDSLNRRRTFSGNSGNRFGVNILARRFDRIIPNHNCRSSSCEELTLPKPVCRKHSNQYNIGGHVFPYYHNDINHHLCRNTIMNSSNNSSNVSLEDISTPTTLSVSSTESIDCTTPLANSDEPMAA